MLASCVISVILIQGSAAKDATCSQPEHTGDEPSLLQARYEFDSEAMLRPAVEPRSCTFEDFGEYGIFVPHCLPPPPPKRLASCWVPRQGIDLEDLPDCFNTYDGETLKETYTKAVDDTTEWPEFCTMEDFKAVFTISDDDGANCMRKARKKLVPFCECAAWKSTVSNEDVPSCWNDVERELLMDTFHSCQDASLPACTPQEYMTVGDDPNLCLTHPDGDEDRFCDCWAPTGSVQVPPICWNTFLHEPLYVSFDKCKKIRPEAPTESPTAAPTAAPTALPTAEKKTCCTEPTAKCLSCLMTNMTAHEFCAKYPGLYDCPKATTPSPTKSPTKACCTEMTATCLSCWGHMTVEDFCAQNVGLYDCPPGQMAKYFDKEFVNQPVVNSEVAEGAVTRDGYHFDNFTYHGNKQVGVAQGYPAGR